MVETLSLDDWLRHPLSRIVPQEVGYVVKFRGADPSGRFTRHWIDQLSEERANMIATFFGWRIRKGKRGDDLVARKTALNHVDALIAKHGEATAETLSSRRAADLEPLLVGAGITGGRYARKGQRAEMLVQWAKQSHAHFAAMVAEAAWIGPASAALRAGTPINKAAAVRYHLSEIAIAQFGYEPAGGFLVKGAGERWTCQGRGLSRPELEERIASAEKSLAEFDRGSAELAEELRLLSTRNAGGIVPLDPAKLEEMKKCRGAINSCRKALGSLNLNSVAAAEFRDEVAELERRVQSLEAETGGMISPSFDPSQVDRLIFLARVVPRRAGLRMSMILRLDELRALAAAPPDQVVARPVPETLFEWAA